jgi:GT2 family glycosyltransferase
MVEGAAVVKGKGTEEGPPCLTNDEGSSRRKIAVVIPVRNRPDLLERCLDSLTRQSFPMGECEVIVCDDSSQDDLGPVVQKFREKIPGITLLRQQGRKGPAAARNMGFRSSRADLFVCIDSDMTGTSGFIKELVTRLESNPGWVAAEAKILPGDHRPSLLWDAPDNKGGAFPSGASAYRAEALRRVGGFDEAFLLPACEDVDLAMRLLKIGTFGYVPEAVTTHPVRRVTWRTHWRWRRHWRYETFLAKRHGILAFPGHPCGRFPRTRVARAAVLTLPAGRLIEAIRSMKDNPVEGGVGCVYALFDVFCGIVALPDILFSRVPPWRNYLVKPSSETDTRLPAERLGSVGPIHVQEECPK